MSSEPTTSLKVNTTRSSPLRAGAVPSAESIHENANWQWTTITGQGKYEDCSATSATLPLGYGNLTEHLVSEHKDTWQRSSALCRCRLNCCEGTLPHNHKNLPK